MLTWLKSTYHFNVGNFHMARGRFGEAAASFGEVIRLAPTHSPAYINRGVALQGMNDHQRAIGDFDHAIGLMSGFSPAHRSLAYGNRGVSWKLQGDFDRAAADYRQALALTPRSPLAHAELGVIAYLRHDFDAAISHLNTAIGLAPRDAAHYAARGRARFDRGDFAAAEIDLRYSINIAADAYTLLFWHLANIKIGRDTAEEFASRTRRMNRQQWPFPIVALYLGMAGDGDVRSAALTADHRAEAEFYIGEWHLHARRRPEAITALQVAAQSCPAWFDEHTAAVMELERQRAPLVPAGPASSSPAQPAPETHASPTA